MSLCLLLKQATRGYVKKGSKRYRKTQVQRMKKFILFAEARGAHNWGQIGPRTWRAFNKEFNFSEDNKRLYERAIRRLEKLIGIKLISL